MKMTILIAILLISACDSNEFKELQKANKIKNDEFNGVSERPDSFWAFRLVEVDTPAIEKVDVSDTLFVPSIIYSSHSKPRYFEIKMIVGRRFAAKNH